MNDSPNRSASSASFNHPDLLTQLAVKARLDRTWSAFFGRHGSFTTSQLLAIPALLAGANIMLCAPTASGKTEAVIAPLIERHLSPENSANSITILYLTPTKALANDLWARLTPSLNSLGISLGIKTRDLNTLSRTSLPTILITTPESCDSLLASRARAFINVRAIVLDELHLFDGTPRGDHLRVILNRIRYIRTYAKQHSDAPDAKIQYVALSASMAQPAQVAHRYFPDAQLIEIRGTRPIHAELNAISPDNADALLDYLNTFRARGWRKALAFCNSRVEVEAYAATVRDQSPFGDAVYVHYSNLEGKHRREIEQRFATAGVAICFASSTLELGIDIGSIDVILLIGAPGSVASFIQRAGRGSRRQAYINLACFYRTELERWIFEALCHQPSVFEELPNAFRPAVAVQQIFSLLKQSMTGSIRFAELAALFDGMLSYEDLQAIVGQLEALHYLRPGRSGEWRSGERLNQLADQQANPHQTLSLYSNIKSSEGHTVEIRDRHTDQTIARVDPQWLDRTTLTLEGRAVDVEWYDGEAIWIRPARVSRFGDRLQYTSARQLLSYDLAQKLAVQAGLKRDESPLLEYASGWLWFHWLGDVYGLALRELLSGSAVVRTTDQPGLCILFSANPGQTAPDWSTEQITYYLGQKCRKFETLLDLGPYQHLLSTALRRRAVIAQFDVERFRAALGHLKLFYASDSLAASLQALITG